MRWGLFFLGEYAAMFALSGIASVLFLGGWTGPVHALAEGWSGFSFSLFGADFVFSGSLLGGIAEFSYKTIALFIGMLWVRWTLPRLRLDQVMSLCYKYLVPAAMVCMLACGAAALLAGPAPSVGGN
jgi:NADH-quinone oxidoreductase subunit H